MLFYLVIYLLAIALAWASDEFPVLASRLAGARASALPAVRQRVISDVLFCLSGCVLLLVRGLRCGIGVDYFFSYVPKFEAALSGGEVWGDKLYGGLIYLCSMISDDYKLFFFVDSVLFIGAVYLAIYLAKVRRGFSVALFLLGFHLVRSMNMQAQYLALAFCLLAIALYVFLDKRALSLIVVLIASAFHASALLMLVPMAIDWALCRVSAQRRKVVALSSCVALPVLSVALRGVFPVVVEALLSNGRFAWYFGTKYDDGEFSGYLFLINAALLALMLAICLRQKDDLTHPCILALLFQGCALAASVLTGTVPLMYRVVYCFMIAPVVLLGPVIGALPKKRAALTMLIVLLGFSVVHFAYLSPQDTDRVIPYVSVFDSAKTIEGIRQEISVISKY